MSNIHSFAVVPPLVRCVRTFHPASTSHYSVPIQSVSFRTIHSRHDRLPRDRCHASVSQCPTLLWSTPSIRVHSIRTHYSPAFLSICLRELYELDQWMWYCNLQMPTATLVHFCFGIFQTHLCGHTSPAEKFNIASKCNKQKKNCFVQQPTANHRHLAPI